MQIHKDKRFQELIERMEALLIEGRTDEMRLLLEQLQTLAEKELDDIGLAAAYFYRDLLKEKKPGCEPNMEYAKRALKIAETKDIPYYMMKVCNNLGIMYSQVSDFHIGLEYYLKALHISEIHPEFCYESVLLNNVGNLFMWLEEEVEASSYLERAYYKSITENKDDRQLSAFIIMNLIELYSNIENYDKVREWEEKNCSLLTEDDKTVVNCINLINKSKQLLQNGCPEEAKDNIYAFIKRTEGIQDFTFIFRCYINALKVGIQLEDFPLCSSLVEKLEMIQKDPILTTFSYDFATIKLEYWLKFQDRLEPGCHPYFEEYFTQSENRIIQLRDTYAKSLSVKTMLEEVKEEKKYVQQQNELLKKDIERDIFTNLYNKVSTEKYVRKAMRERVKDKLQGFMLIDIDLFKRINDNYGHGFGDEVIISVAESVELAGEGSKIAGRFGGDEFLLFLDMQDSVEAIIEAAEKLQTAVASKVQLPDDKVPHVTLSIGICVIDSDIGFEQAFDRADKALYRAKELGRNRYELAC